MTNLKSIAMLVFKQFFVITVCVMLVISLCNIWVQGFNYTISADFPWVMMLTGAVGAMPSVLFFFKEEPSKKKFAVRMIIHFVVLSALILFEGRILNWYESFSDGLTVFGMIVFVYALVMIFTIIIEKADAYRINRALKSFNIDEK